MPEYQHQFPHELSGGQSQRVALARAIAPQPKLLLMDEPFSNLDSELRESLGYEVRSLLKELGITAIMVTHDQHDAFALGDRIGVMSQGQMLQWDNSYNLYHAPHNRFVANFIGDGVFVKGEMIEKNAVITGIGEIRGESVNHPHVGKQVDLLIRPDDVRYDPDSPIRGQVVRKAFKGAQTLYTLVTESGETLLSMVPSHDDHEIGDIIGVAIEADHLVCFAQGDV
jgi:iron(III) transport system ATP-binding protein